MHGIKSQRSVDIMTEDTVNTKENVDIFIQRKSAKSIKVIKNAKPKIAWIGILTFANGSKIIMVEQDSLVVSIFMLLLPQMKGK